MRVAILSYKTLPTITDLGTRKAGGQSLNIYYMLKYLPKLGVDLTFLNGASDDNPNQPLSLADHAAIPEYSDQIKSALLQYPVDLVHTCGIFAGEAFLIARKSSGKLQNLPWVHSNFATLSQRRFYADAEPLNRLAQDEIYQREKRTNQSAGFIVTGSENEARELKDLFGVDSAHTATIYRGVDHTIFYARRGKRPITIISCGRMAPIKDFPFLIESIRFLAACFPTLISREGCLIVGGSEDERNQLGLPELVRQSGLTSIIRFVDATSHHRVAELLRQARVFVGTSRHETFGLLPVEARACGTPTVLRNNSCYPEMPGAQSGGLISSNTSPEAFASDIARILMADESEWQKYSDQAVATSRQFSWMTYARRHMEIYEQLVKVSK